MVFVTIQLCVFLDTIAPHSSLCFFFNDTATTEIYTLSLHDALPISVTRSETSITTRMLCSMRTMASVSSSTSRRSSVKIGRAQSELQSRLHLVCRLLLEKKKRTL